jgi:hypothetical protein
MISPDLRREHGTENEAIYIDPQTETVCFTVGQTDRHSMFRQRQTDDMFHDMFTICLCISPDLDGNRGTPKNMFDTI